ncbi:unnamed protein product [Nesidiocoris tenuis]|uniref:Uncharacterized protein n=1 Tax=Nesidiocoris tenuis TaxID=355587 RepID=A0A6H5H225_9HEMI|nr:unnamed protein product [Nesidiocoris tenuis]
MKRTHEQMQKDQAVLQCQVEATSWRGSTCAGRLSTRLLLCFNGIAYGESTAITDYKLEEWGKVQVNVNRPDLSPCCVPIEIWTETLSIKQRTGQVVSGEIVERKSSSRQSREECKASIEAS